MEETKYIIINDTECFLEWSKYPTTNQTKLQLWAVDGPYMTATKEVEHLELADEEIVIKSYSENEGLLEILIKEEIVAKPYESITLQFGDKLHICQIIN